MLSRRLCKHGSAPRYGFWCVSSESTLNKTLWGMWDRGKPQCESGHYFYAILGLWMKSKHSRKCHRQKAWFSQDCEFVCALRGPGNCQWNSHRHHMWICLQSSYYCSDTCTEQHGYRELGCWWSSYHKAGKVSQSNVLHQKQSHQFFVLASYH